MADFDFSTLVTDRSASDLELLRGLLSTPMEDWTAEQLAAFNQAISKGAYNYTDLNRVTAAMDYLNERLTALGYQTGYSKVEIPHQGGGGTALPEGYTPLEYVQSSGTQYINSGYAPNQNTRVVADVQLMEQTTATVAFFGVRDTAAANSPNKFIAWSMTTGQSIRSDYFGTSSNPTSNISVVGKRITIDKNRNICSFGETVLTNTLATGQCQNNMFLFAGNNEGKANYFGLIKLYSCQVYDNDNLIRDFIPCINAEGVVGLYDTVGAQFYGNAGTGEFIAGYEGTELPNGYIKLEYIEASGEQYIDTEFQPNQDTRIIIDAKINNVVTENLPLCGARRSSTASAFSIWISADAVNSQYGSVPYDTNPISISYTQRLTYDFNRNVLTVGNQSATYQATVFSTGSNLLLCSISTNGSADSRRVSAKIYSCQVYDDNNLIRNFVPCKNSAGEIGLYDLVTDTYYQNAGTGVFTAGPDIMPGPDPDPESTKDPYLWYKDDVPTTGLLNAYLANVAALRNVIALPEDTPEVPADMVGLTQTEANNIEGILEIIYQHLTALQAVFLRAGMGWAVSGGPGYYFENGG